MGGGSGNQGKSIPTKSSASAASAPRKVSGWALEQPEAAHG